ncbi:MAG: hypothetical protein KA324_19765, partial [Rubrivivax sp.]|nr:hypothetical protein [Rubrivivax sp.]
TQQCGISSRKDWSVEVGHVDGLGGAACTRGPSHLFVQVRFVAETRPSHKQDFPIRGRYPQASTPNSNINENSRENARWKRT